MPMLKLTEISKTFIYFVIVCILVVLIHVSLVTDDDDDRMNMMEVRFSRAILPNESQRRVMAMKPKKGFQKKVFFLKTHKTGSSTIYNILARLSLTYDLTPLLLNGYGTGLVHIWPARFTQKYYYVPKGVRDSSQIFDVYMEHVRFDRKNCEILFPKKSTFYFTIMRDPVTGWRSTFEYFRLAGMFGVSNSPNPIKSFFGKNFDKRLQKWANKIPIMQLLVNGLLFDLGYNQMDIHTSKLGNIIKELERDFDLIMIMEYFDESLIILKNRLNLSYTDIVTFNMNESYGTKKETLTADVKTKINKLNYADRYVYDYFRKKFETFLSKNSKIVRDAGRLRDYRKHVYNVCIAKRTAKFAYGSVYYFGYELKSQLTTTLKDLCQKLIYSELEIKALLAKSAKAKFHMPMN